VSFTEQESEFIRSQPLGRIATVSAEGQPDVVPVAVEFDGQHFWVGGPGPVVKTRKFRNVAAGNPLVSIVFDDFPSFDPFIARGIRIYGRAEQPIERTGMVGSGTYMRITPVTSWTWNLAGEAVSDEWYPVVRTDH
jgi:pyridoxamine 5'-phosphate oxidase family protein